jgi:hypothetical protein
LRGYESVWLWKSDWIVDDGDLGFQRFHGANWAYRNTGYNDDSWTAPATNDEDDSFHYAIWTPELAGSGEYNIDVYIPNISNLVTAAQYEIIIKDSAGINTKNIVTVDQTINSNNFSTIATVDLQAGSNCAVILRDIVDSTSTGLYVSFDAIRFVNTQQVGIGVEDNQPLTPNRIVVYPSYPNPFNSSTTILYEVLQKNMVVVSIFDISGNHVYTLTNELKSPGKYSVLWGGEGNNNQVVPSGLYYCVITANGFRDTQKILLLK